MQIYWLEEWVSFEEHVKILLIMVQGQCFIASNWGQMFIFKIIS